MLWFFAKHHRSLAYHGIHAKRQVFNSALPPLTFSLFQLIQSGFPHIDKVRNRIFLEICLGMHYLHCRKIMHRDLKSLNILLDSDFHAKITDFGLSKTKELTSTNSSYNVLGSIPWTAPEYMTIKRKNDRNEKGDVFAFGVIVWEVVTLQTPWEGEEREDVREIVLEGNRLEIPEKTPPQLKKIMQQCWEDSIVSSMSNKFILYKDLRTDLLLLH